MRKLLPLLAIAGASVFSFQSFAGTAKAAALPRLASEFVIQQTNGQQILLSSFRGKPVVLALMYATCSHCQYTAGQLNQLQQEFAAKGVQVLGATFGEGDASLIDVFKKQLHITFPCGYSNGPAVLSFLKMPQDQPYFVPILVFIDRKGMIRQQIIGDEKFLSGKDQANNIRAEVEKLLRVPAGTAASSNSTRKAPKSE